MTVCARFQLVAVTDHHGGGKTLKFETRYDHSIPEHRRFMKATPWGHIEMRVDNPAALEHFHLGHDYYLDIHAVRVAETTTT